MGQGLDRRGCPWYTGLDDYGSWHKVTYGPLVRVYGYIASFTRAHVAFYSMLLERVLFMG